MNRGELDVQGGLGAAPEKPESPSDWAWEMQSAALQQLFPQHTHTAVTVIYYTLIYTLTNCETCTSKHQMIHIFHHKQFTVPHDSCCVLWMDIHRKIYFFAQLQKAGLYLAVFIDSGLTHYTVLFSISQIHCKSPDTTYKKKKQREREKW